MSLCGKKTLKIAIDINNKIHVIRGEKNKQKLFLVYQNL